MIEVRAPSVGSWEPAVKKGALVRGGDRVGVLRVLGVAQAVVAEGTGIVVDGVLARGPVSYGQALYVLDPAAVVGAESHEAAAGKAAESGHVFRAPTSGRFYSRPGPGKPAFVSAGDLISDGQTVCMLEVMKTFNRVVYDGADARVLEVAVADEADVDAGAVLLRLGAP